jgi:hypothetical protein
MVFVFFVGNPDILPGSARQEPNLVWDITKELHWSYHARIVVRMAILQVNVKSL